MAKGWRDGVGESWVMERWSGGEVEWWSDGVVEWSNGGKEKEASIEVVTPTLHYSTPPFLLAPPSSRTSNFPQKSNSAVTI